MAEANAQAPLALPNPTLENIETPFAGDLLRRRELATTLTDYLGRLRSGAVLALDAPWGEGKTWFARHWAAQLHQDGYRVGVIDAFEQDYIEDPFLLIAAELTQLCAADENAAKTFRQKVASAATTVLPFLAKVGVNALGRLAGTSDLADGISEAAEAASDDAADAAKAWVEKRLAGYAAEKASVLAFKKEVEAFAATASSANGGKPVVIFIDELDRCRPAFAVRLIERIKHFFDVPNLVFVLVMNRDQLEKAIQGVYGERTDASAYLGKFLHLSLRLPKNRSLEFKPSHPANVFVRATLSRYKEIDRNSGFPAALAVMAIVADLSLRDIERACALYYLSDRAWDGLMACLIAVKIKRPDTFQQMSRLDFAGRQAFAQTVKDLFGAFASADKRGIAQYAEMWLAFARVISQGGDDKDEQTLTERREVLFGRDWMSSPDPHHAYSVAVRSLDLDVQ